MACNVPSTVINRLYALFYLILKWSCELGRLTLREVRLFLQVSGSSLGFQPRCVSGHAFRCHHILLSELLLLVLNTTDIRQRRPVISSICVPSSFPFVVPYVWLLLLQTSYSSSRGRKRKGRGQQCPSFCSGKQTAPWLTSLLIGQNSILSPLATGEIGRDSSFMEQSIWVPPNKTEVLLTQEEEDDNRDGSCQCTVSV